MSADKTELRDALVYINTKSYVSTYIIISYKKKNTNNKRKEKCPRRTTDNPTMEDAVHYYNGDQEKKTKAENRTAKAIEIA